MRPPAADGPRRPPSAQHDRSGDHQSHAPESADKALRKRSSAYAVARAGPELGRTGRVGQKGQERRLPTLGRSRVSEYQYYEFRALNKPLTKQQQKELRSLSSRAEITSVRKCLSSGPGRFRACWTTHDWTGCPVPPRIRMRRGACSMGGRTQNFLPLGGAAGEKTTARTP